MKIKKIYINNFKGIKEKKIIDFENQISLLVGPNGFGKTTIFDILELCLTGKIQRTLNKKSVTSDTKDYKKPFYQNTSGKDVVVKLWLEKIDGSSTENFIIVKYLSKDNNGKKNGRGKKNKPEDFLFETYKDEIEDFEKEEFIPKIKIKIGQQEINKFFQFNMDNFEIEKIYNLFNYIQQEETTYFLKKSEKERRGSLAFLFQTEKQEEICKSIKDKISKLGDISKELNSKIENITCSERNVGEENLYLKLFKDKEFDFDKKELFENLNSDEINFFKDKFEKEINGIQNFVESFAPEEYEKKEKSEILDKFIKDEDFLNSYILQNFLITENYLKIKQEIELFEEDFTIKAFLLKNFINDYIKYKENNNKYEQYKSFKETKSFEEKTFKLKEIIEEEKSEEYFFKLEEREKLKETNNIIQNSIKDIIDLRSEINKIVNTNKELFITGECPYCGEKLGSLEKLKNKFKSREKKLQELLDDQSNLLFQCENDIKKNYIALKEAEVNSYLESHIKIDNEIIIFLEECQNKNFDFKFLDKDEQIKKMIIEELPKNENIEKLVLEVKDKIRKNTTVSNKIFELIEKCKSFSIKNKVEKLEKAIDISYINKMILLDKDKQITYSILNRQKEKIKKYFESIRINYVYEIDKTQDENNFYSKYFFSNKLNFKKLEKDFLIKKRDYINLKYAEKENEILALYKNRKEKLDKIINKLNELKVKNEKIITDYKKNMVDKIKLPFYIYTGKILQNYQQGMGVFIHTNESNEAIRFITDSTSDHDAMHHLSSGQLAIISLAFTLAINKVYNLTENLKILAIDDPIQELDSLNIHSFIELIRNEFLEDYQMIFSTHSDINAFYMKYKFNRLNDKSTSLINIQEKLFG